MSQVDGSIVKSSENVAATAGGWRDGILVLASVLAPLGLAIALFMLRKDSSGDVSADGV